MRQVTLSDGTVISVPSTGGAAADDTPDFTTLLQNKGYISLKDPGLDWFRQSGQGNFATPEDYWRWAYGGGNVASDPTTGEQYFKTPNGVGNYVNQPLNYNTPDTFSDMLGLYLVGGIAGLGALAGAGAGAAGAGEASIGGLSNTAGVAGEAFGGAGAAGGAGSGAYTFGGDMFTGGNLFPNSYSGSAGGTGMFEGFGSPYAGAESGGLFGNLQNMPTGATNIFGGSGSDNGIPSGSFNYGGEGGVPSGLNAADGGLSNGLNLSNIFGNNWMNIAGSLGAAALQWLGSREAAQIQAQYGNQALALMAQQMAQNQANIQPWINAGTAGLTNVAGLMGLPGYEKVDFTKTPGYDFRYGEGMNQLENQLRAAGKFYSGDALKGGQQYAQNFATNEYTNAINRGLALSGMGQAAVNSANASGTAGTNAQADLLTQLGNVQAAGRVSGYNALGSGINNYLNNQNQQQLMALLLANNNNNYSLG